jgi:general secretion pathway protein M
MMRSDTSRKPQDAPTTDWRQHPAWQRLQPRERSLVLAAVVLVLVAAWWLGLVGPAWRQWTTAPQRLTQLHHQLQTMQSLAAVARSLQAQPSRTRDERLAALEQATRSHLGGGSSVKAMGDTHTVQLAHVTPDALARWLADVRINAQLTPDTVQLLQVPKSAQGPGQTEASGPVSWQGSVRFVLGN